jgi:hypothetical protein
VSPRMCVCVGGGCRLKSRSALRYGRMVNCRCTIAEAGRVCAMCRGASNSYLREVAVLPSDTHCVRTSQGTLLASDTHRVQTSQGRRVEEIAAGDRSSAWT